MTVSTLTSVPQALKRLLYFPPNFGWIFRGQSDSSWLLIPKAGRSPFYRGSDLPNLTLPRSKENPPFDLGRFSHWRELAVGYCDNLPENQFECLAFAQHYGLPTRLLDFTENALAALYFACETKFDVDGALYAHIPNVYIRIHEADLFTFDCDACLSVTPFDRRILSQRAKFMFFRDPSAPLSPGSIDAEIAKASSIESNLVKFIIPAASKKAIHLQLRSLGISRRTYFPDLDGLSRDFVAEDIVLADLTWRNNAKLGAK